MHATYRESQKEQILSGFWLNFHRSACNQNGENTRIKSGSKKETKYLS